MITLFSSQRGFKATALIQNIQGAAGGFRATMKDAHSSEHIWITAQCVSALLAAGDFLGKRADFSKAFQWINGQKKNHGWYDDTTDPSEPAPKTEITAWVGLAYVEGLANPSVFNRDAEQQEAKAALASIYTMLSNRQSPSGGWASYPTSYASPNEYGAYATFMAMEFLVSLMREKGGGIAEPSTLMSQIAKGVKWILSGYDHKIQGWEDTVGSGPTTGLSTLYLSVLVSAKEVGPQTPGNFIEANKEYQNARRNWLNHTLEDATKRTMSDNTPLKQPQIYYGVHGTLIGKAQPVTVVWYPWALLIATHMAADNALPVGERTVASKIAIKLWERLSETVRTFDTAESFFAAETLYVLGLIGKKYGWLAQTAG
jgi:hypothetical protein